MLQIVNEMFCYITVAFGLCAVFIATFLRRILIGEGGPEPFPVKPLCVFLICTGFYFGFAMCLGNMLSAFELYLRCMTGALIISLGIGLFTLKRVYKLIFAFFCLIPSTIFGTLWFLVRFYVL